MNDEKEDCTRRLQTKMIELSLSIFFCWLDSYLRIQVIMQTSHHISCWRIEIFSYFYLRESLGIFILLQSEKVKFFGNGLTEVTAADQARYAHYEGKEPGRIHCGWTMIRLGADDSLRAHWMVRVTGRILANYLWQNDVSQDPSCSVSSRLFSHRRLLLIACWSV